MVSSSQSYCGAATHVHVHSVLPVRWALVVGLFMCTQLVRDINLREEAELRRLEGFAIAVADGSRTPTVAVAPTVVSAEAVPLQLVTAVRLPGQSDTLPVATALGPHSGALAPMVMGDSVTIDVGAQVRTAKKRRRKDLLAEKWYCQYCRTYTARSEDKCRGCSTPRANLTAHVESEQLRLKSREKRKKGRQLNRAGAGAAASVERAAAAVLDAAEHDAAVEREVTELSAAIGDAGTNSSDESKLAIIESFLLVHYKGEHSLLRDAKAAGGISGHVVANFFNTIGRVADAGEWCFPMGGYFNTFKESGVTAGLLWELREIVRTQFGGGHRSGAVEAVPIMRSATAFKEWYASSEARKSDTFRLLGAAVTKALQRFCAALYAPGGRLNHAAVRHGVALPKAADFKVRWLPDTVLHTILWRLYSKVTSRWLNLKERRSADALNMAHGFKSENDELSGELRLYTGNYMLQLSKAFSVALRAATDGVDSTEMPLARRARFLAVKNATRLRRYRSIAVTDDIFVEAVMDLDLDYSWDHTLFTAMCDAETVALRRQEVFQQDRGDCEQTTDGEKLTLPKTKADQQSEGIVRLKRHWKSCIYAHDAQLGFSKESACKVGANGKLDGRTRCQVCAKRSLFEMQGVLEVVPWVMGVTMNTCNRTSRIAA